MIATQELDVFTCPLEGTSLIEASAGTGKTWNLCGLYLRLLLERGLAVQSILVVTFTNAATAELRERIRSRIVETLTVLRGGAAEGGDAFVPRLIDTLRSAHGMADEAMGARLDLALQTFDEAAIFTIHGFCQRALADTPFTAQLPLALELVQDDAELLAEAANDFWRRRVAGDALDPAMAACLVQRKDSPAKFARLLKRHLAKPLSVALWPQGIDAPGEVDAAALAAAHGAARTLWHAGRDAIVQCLLDAKGLHGGSYKPDAIQAAARGWDALLAEDDALATLDATPDKVELFGRTKMKPNKGQRAPEHGFFDAAQALLDLRSASAQTLALTRLALLRDLLREGSAALRGAKRRQRVVAFDDMLFNLYDKLTGGDAPWLAGALKARFPAALIDEFQDTDPLQFAIFKAVYGPPRPSRCGVGHQTDMPEISRQPPASAQSPAGSGIVPPEEERSSPGRPGASVNGSAAPLFLVGDPKQAIYSFRNADLHTYLRAREEASAEYTLVKNQRASEPLIDALNGLFGANERAFMLPGLAYRQVGLGARPPQPLVDRTLPRAPLQVWTLPADAKTGAPMLKADAQAAAVAATAGEIARLIAAARQGDITLAGAPLRAGDIAVLVRSHAQGSAVRQALAALGVGSVELSQASIYRSADAEELDRLLAAILEPTRERLLKAALSTQLMGLDAAAIAALADDEAAMLGWVQRFAARRDTWLSRGVGTMLRELMRSEHLPERLLARPDGERRMTNLLHLAECLQQAAETHAAPDALLRWFQTQRNDERSDDATQLRLESDRNLVQIVTIHKAKGLEYGIVFCPFLWVGGRGGFADGIDGVEYHDDDGQSVIDYRQGFAGEFDKDDVKRRRRLEGAAETLRLAYVALTRAVHRCVLVAGCYTTVAFGKPTTTESTRSLLNWLVAGQGLSPEQWFEGKQAPSAIAAAWAALASRHGPALGLAPLPLGAARPVPDERTAPDALAARPPPRHIAPAWRIGSYSALAFGSTHELAAADHDLRVAAEPDTPLRAAAPAVPAPAARLDDDDILRFPRGAAAGECVHAVFERADFTDATGWPAAIADALRLHGAALPGATRHVPTLDGATLSGTPPMGAAEPSTDAPRASEEAPGRSGAAHPPPERRAPSDDATSAARMLHRMLADVLATPLPLGTALPLRLADLPRSRRLTELEFHLPSHRLDAAALNATLAELGYAVPRLAFAPLRGYLKGFIDLVLEHDGRYFVIDWKSNHLGHTPADYAPAPLAAAMAAQGYHLQALLYCVALDRFLRHRMPGYDAGRHFGGVAYLFVRGLRPGWTCAGGVPAGLHFHRPAPEAIRRVSALFDDPDPCAPREPSLRATGAERGGTGAVAEPDDMGSGGSKMLSTGPRPTTPGQQPDASPTEADA